jgi:radical SAM protein with 4Fe4S-binding SPASM domain
VFSEEVNPYAMANVSTLEDFDALLFFPSSALFIDTDLMELYVKTFIERESKITMLISQVLWGFNCPIFKRELILGLAKISKTVGEILDLPTSREAILDVNLQECFFNLPENIQSSRHRFTWDSSSSVEFVSKLVELTDGKVFEMKAEEIIKLADERLDSLSGSLPREVVLEVVSFNNLSTPASQIRAQSVDLMNWDTYENIIKQLANYDDVKITLGGLGEPLLHPLLYKMIRLAKETGIYGIHIETNAILLGEDFMKLFIDECVDVISIRLGDIPDDSLGLVTNNIGNLMQMKKNLGKDLPSVVVELQKTPNIINELDLYFEEWSRRVDWVLIAPYNDFCGKLPDVNVIPLLPPKRTLCEKLKKKMLILPDGKMPLCEQDIGQEYVVGNVFDGISKVWNSSEISKIRKDHKLGIFNNTSICPKCKVWYF